MISLCFFQFQNQNFGKSNFWIWQLYLNSDLYTAIVGLPLLYSIGNYLISSFFFSSDLVIFRFKDKLRLFRNKLLIQFLFLVLFILLVNVIAMLISILSTKLNSNWTLDNIKGYSLAFSSRPYLKMPLLMQTTLTLFNFSSYLFFLLLFQFFLRLMFKAKSALVIVVMWIFLQSFFYKITNASSLLLFLPLSHYQVVNVTNVMQNVIYWVVLNGFGIALNHYCSKRLNIFD
ncbi:hypothetical protein [Streptococcus iniae]|nr:hypothetical protein [Streptococcus iniae]